MTTDLESTLAILQKFKVIEANINGLQIKFSNDAYAPKIDRTSFGEMDRIKIKEDLRKEIEQELFHSA